jgi:hypothetical protein
VDALSIMSKQPLTDHQDSFPGKTEHFLGIVVDMKLGEEQVRHSESLVEAVSDAAVLLHIPQAEPIRGL